MRVKLRTKDFTQHVKATQFGDLRNVESIKEGDEIKGTTTNGTI